MQTFSVTLSQSFSLSPWLCWPAAALIDVECDRVNNWTFLIIVIKAAIHCGDGSNGGSCGVVVSAATPVNSYSH